MLFAVNSGKRFLDVFLSQPAANERGADAKFHGFHANDRPIGTGIAFNPHERKPSSRMVRSGSSNATN